ncbi:pentapeptide repeat-containing protein [Streptomyces sp. NPDC002559]
MTPSRRSQSPNERELRLWEVRRALALAFVAAVLAAGSIFYVLVVLLDFKEIDTGAKLDAKTLFDLVKVAFGVVAGAGALVALVVAYRRQRVDEAGAHRESTRLHTERFSQAIDKLGSDSPAVRLGGVHALAGLADDAPTQDLRQTCIDVLCAYLLLPFAPDPGEDPAHQEEHHRFLALRAVRHTILRLIGDHYRRPQGTHRSWQGCDLDLTGAVIDGNMDFTGAEFSSGRVKLMGANFSDGMVIFDRATFSGGTVAFMLTEFSGSRVSFRNATFSDGVVVFDRATFSDGTMDFYEAKFSGSLVSFDRATFSDGVVSFDRATFPGGQVSFRGSEISGGRVSFRGSEISGGEVSFMNAELTSGELSFMDIELTGGEVSFMNAELTGCEVSFMNAELTGGTVDFLNVTGPTPHGLLRTIGTPASAVVIIPSAWTPSVP